MTIHEAVCANDFERVDYFLRNGVNIDSRDQKNCTPLQYAVINGNLEMVKFLIRNLSDVNIHLQEGTLLDYSLTREYNQISKVLIRNGINLNKQNSLGNSSIMTALKLGNFEMIEYLLLKNIRVNTINNINETPLILASRLNKNSYEISKKLIKKGARGNIFDLKNKSALIYAVENKNIPLIKLLIKNGSDPLLHRGNSLSAVQLAKQLKFDFIVKVLAE